MIVFSIEIFLLVLFLLACFGQVYFYLHYFLKLAAYSEVKKNAETNLPVSLILAVKNERENLIRHLPLLVNQNYSTFEIIIIDDHSVDGTGSWIKSQNFSAVKYIPLDKKFGKKAAVAKGVEAAKYEALLLTDADCYPASDEWMSLMGEKLQTENSIVLGYGRYEKKAGLLNALIRFETFQTALQYLSFAIQGKAYMGVGRNLAYRKKLFSESRSIERFANIRSGDDDLLVNEMAQKANVKICIQAEAHTISKPKTTWKDYFLQKRRHLQAGTKYKQADRIRLAALGISTLIFWICFLLLCSKASFNMIIFPIFAVKLMLQYFILRRIMQKLQVQDLLFWAPFMEFFYIIWMTAVGVSTRIWKVERWK